MQQLRARGGGLRLGDPAPHFSGLGTFGKVSLSDYQGKWLTLFSYPEIFSPICATELLAFAQEHSAFKELGCELLGLSTESVPAQLGWVTNLYKCTGVSIPFPLYSDPGGAVAARYGMQCDARLNRMTYLISPDQTIAAAFVYPNNVGRNISEIVRVLQALQMCKENGWLTPANWMPEQSALLPPPATVAQIEKKQEEAATLCMDWYLCFCNPE